MGSSINGLAKHGLRFGNKIMPHTWVLGSTQSRSIDLGGQVAGAYDNQYKPADVEAPASPIVDDDAYRARDRMRRLARKAQGQPSTIRAGLTQPYTGQPESLLGS